MARRCAALALFVVAMAIAPRARGDELAEYEKARNAYLARAYDEADQRFRVLLDPKAGTLKERALLSPARMFWAATLHAKGQKKEATALFEQLLLEDPQYEPDPLSFPTGVVNEFIDTRARIRQMLKEAAEEAARRAEERRAKEAADKARQAQRVATLEKLAREETVLERHSRLVASLPFGAGQFQNGQETLGWIFLGTEAALVVAGGIMLPLYLSELQSASDAYNARDRVAADQYIERANQIQIANLALYGAFAATALAGIAHAHITFAPEFRTVRPRALPPAAKSTWSPFVVPTETAGRGPDGAVLGVVGRF